MAPDKKRLGRPPKAPRPGERVALGLKVTAEIKQRLDEAARKSGRTQSQQAELMIERAFFEESALGGPEVRQLVDLMASAFAFAGQRGASGNSNWVTDPPAYIAGIVGVLDALLLGLPNGEDKALAREALIGHLLSLRAREREQSK